MVACGDTVNTGIGRRMALLMYYIILYYIIFVQRRCRVANGTANILFLVYPCVHRQHTRPPPPPPPSGPAAALRTACTRPSA